MYEYEPSIGRLASVPGATSVAGDAYTGFLSVLHWAAGEVGRLRRDALPGLLEAVEDGVVITFARDSRAKAPLGRFSCEAWNLEGRGRVDEIFINAQLDVDPRHGAESVLTTLVHELVHLWNRVQGTPDTSNRGRYHNERFGRPAVAAGLLVVRQPVVQNDTPGLAPEAIGLYSDILAELTDALVLVGASTQRVADTAVDALSVPAGGDATPESATVHLSVLLGDELRASTKYVSAQCACEDGRGARRTMRMARGWWALGPVTCGVCTENFTPAVPPKAAAR